MPPLPTPNPARKERSCHRTGATRRRATHYYTRCLLESHQKRHFCLPSKHSRRGDSSQSSGSRSSRVGLSVWSCKSSRSSSIVTCLQGSLRFNVWWLATRSRRACTTHVAKNTSYVENLDQDARRNPGNRAHATVHQLPASTNATGGRAEGQGEGEGKYRCNATATVTSSRYATTIQSKDNGQESCDGDRVFLL